VPISSPRQNLFSPLQNWVLSNPDIARKTRQKKEIEEEEAFSFPLCEMYCFSHITFKMKISCDRLMASDLFQEEMFSNDKWRLIKIIQ
jgi:hypothetical protein